MSLNYCVKRVLINEVTTSVCSGLVCSGLVCIYIFVCILNENYGYVDQICQ